MQNPPPFLYSLIVVHPGWRYHPAAKIALLLAAGIGTARLFHPSMEALLLWVGLISLALFCCASLPDSRIARVALASTLALLIVASGALLFATRGGYDSPLLPPGVSIERLSLVGEIVEGPRALVSGGTEWRLRVDSLWRRGVSLRLGSDMLVRTYERQSTNLPAQVGDVVLLRGDLRTPTRPGLSNEFDYGVWLQRRGIGGVVTISGGREMTRLGRVEEAGLDWLVTQFRQSVRRYAARTIGGEEGVIATALLTGDRTDIDPELRDSFSATGTAHVLALSGLHVGALALLLFVVLSWIPGRWLRLLLFVSVLGSYAILTGGSPSIVRASLMASFFALAYAIGRISQPLNTLGLAALVILLVDPGALFDVGFQLSFGAVAGILLFYGRLYRWIDRTLPRLTCFAIPRSIVQLFLLSLTAQVGTFPMIGLYFGEFSLLSPLLNVLVVPLISIGFGAAGVGYLLSWVPGVAGWYGATAFLAIGGVIDLVGFVSALSWQDVLLPSVSVIAVFLGVVGLLWVGMARRAGSILFRAIVVGVVFVVPWVFDSVVSYGEGGPDGLYVAPLTRRSGVAVMELRRDSLRLWYSPAWESDSAAAGRLAERYGELFRAEHREVVAVTGPRLDRLAERLIPINGMGPEYLVRGVPLLLSLTGRRGVDRVMIGGEEVLQVPMHGRVGRVQRIAEAD